ncbi:MAG: hypothetical protein IIC93_12685 [Chloroflexi bacterium]|nr:hypothetical protein [Chloroflexota bacterium]
MDQAILRAVVAPTKLAWKSHLGKDLISTYGIDKENASSFPGAVTAVLTVSGDLEGRVLFILTAPTAKSIEAAFNSRWDEGLNQRTFDSVSELMRPIVDNIPMLLETGGYRCAVELSGVMNTKGKSIAGGKEPIEVIMLASTPDFDNPAAKDEISVWVMLGPAGANQDVESPGNEISQQEATSSGYESEDDVEDAGDLTAAGADASSDEGLTQDEAAILNELHAEFEETPQTSLISDQDIADMMAEEGFTAGEPDTVDELEDTPPEEKKPAGRSTVVYPAIHAGVITTEKLEIVDSDGKVRSVLATLRDGSPYLSIADATGRIRATLRLDTEGDARLTFVDEMGAETWMAPRDEPPPAPEQEPASKRAPATPAKRKSESTGPGSNDRKSRLKTASSPMRRRSGALKASPRGKPSKKTRAVASPRRKSPKIARKTSQRRKATETAGVR